MKNKFVHLHLHDKYSILDGLGSIEDFVDKAKELGMETLAQTNHGNLFGSYKFWKVCRSQGVKPILGEEFYVAPGQRTDKTNRVRYHLTLLAKNKVGWDNLCKLSSLAFIEGMYYKPRIDRELLQKYNEGLICLSGCMYGEVAQLLLNKKNKEAVDTVHWYQDLFGKENYYLEMMPHRLDEQRFLNRVFAESFDWCKRVVTNDVHYVNEEDAKYHSYLLKVQTSGGKETVSNFEFGVQGLHLKSADEVEKDLLEFHGLTAQEVEYLFCWVVEISGKVENIEFDKSNKVPLFGG